MPRTKYNSSSRRLQQLTSAISPTIAMRPCKNCSLSSSPKKCRISGQSNKCIEYIRRNYSCDLAPFSPTRQARLEKQRREKSREAKEALAKFTQLQAEVDALERKKEDIFTGKVQNIAKLEQDEGIRPRPNNFLFDLPSKQLVVEDNFDQLSLHFSPSGTVRVGLGSSKDS